MHETSRARRSLVGFTPNQLQKSLVNLHFEPKHFENPGTPTPPTFFCYFFNRHVGISSKE